MYEVKITSNPFEGEEFDFVDYYKDGKRVGTRLTSESHITLVPSGEEHFAPLTRAKAYRYWAKHFPNRSYWTLPELLADALELPCRSFGTFVDRNGETVGYEG